MNTIASYLNFILISILVPLISGPIAGFVFVFILHKGYLKFLQSFWISLIVWNLASFFIMASTLGEFLPGYGFIAMALSPFMALLTIILMVLVRSRLSFSGENDVIRQRAYKTGTLLIPSMQIVVVILLILTGPMLCSTPIRTCLGG